MHWVKHSWVCRMQRPRVLFTLWEDVITFGLDHMICPFSEPSGVVRHCLSFLYLSFGQTVADGFCRGWEGMRGSCRQSGAPVHESEPTWPWTSTEVSMTHLSGFLQWRPDNAVLPGTVTWTCCHAVRLNTSMTPNTSQRAHENDYQVRHFVTCFREYCNKHFVDWVC